MGKTKEFLKPKTTYGDTLRFTAYAWGKLLFIRDRGDTEIAGYGITATEDPLLITDFVLIKQQCTTITFDLDTGDIAEYMERMMDAGLMPWMYANILIHTHPGNCPKPSGDDETNFRKAFSRPDWAIMLIVAQDDSVYCRLKLNIGPGTEKLLKVQVDFSQNFRASDHQAWTEEYQKKVIKQQFLMTGEHKAISELASEENRLFRDYESFNDPFADLTNYPLQDTDLDCNWDYNGHVTYYNDDNGTWYVYDPVEQKWYIESLLDDEEITEIQTPNEPWVAEVVKWAEKHIDRREIMTELRRDGD